ncbi:MAG: radical SAM protein [Microthrixaceae bacterium]
MRSTTRLDVSRDRLGELLQGEPPYRVEQIWDGWYRQHRDTERLTNVPASLRARLADELPDALTEIVRSVGDGGDTVKFLWSLRDGPTIETVLMLYRDRATVCVSTQAGCAMACSFCATGQAGFERHLSAGEILEQVVRAASATDRRVSNVVFMGMGEPLANFDATWTAVTRLHGDVGISARHLTISTVGILPGIARSPRRIFPSDSRCPSTRRTTSCAIGSSRSTADIRSPPWPVPAGSISPPNVADSASSGR